VPEASELREEQGDISRQPSAHLASRSRPFGQRAIIARRRESAEQVTVNVLMA